MNSFSQLYLLKYWQNIVLLIFQAKPKKIGNKLALPEAPVIANGLEMKKFQGSKISFGSGPPGKSNKVTPIVTVEEADLEV